MKRLAAWTLLLVLPMCNACTTPGKDVAQTTRHKDGAHEQYYDEAETHRVGDILLTPFLVPVLPFMLVGYAASACSSKDDRNSSPSPKRQQKPPVKPLPQTT